MATTATTETPESTKRTYILPDEVLRCLEAAKTKTGASYSFMVARAVLKEYGEFAPKKGK